MKRLYTTLLPLALFANITFASSGDTTYTTPFQVTFISPMGTNGLDCGKFTNNVSVNIFTGFAAGVEGLEIGGFFNVLRYDVKGAQIAGFGNTVGGHVDGGQAAGFFNITRGGVLGGQFAGFVNATFDTLNGGQFSGFANLVTLQANGIQGAGFVNVSIGGVNGGQFAGFTNIAGGEVNGIQASGYVNAALQGIDGVQVAGFFNYAKSLRGVQFGIFNYCDSLVEGTPIGLISIIKKGGGNHLEIEASEAIQAGLNLKLGTEMFYNIFSTGLHLENNKQKFALGYGFGTNVKLGEKAGINIDGVAYQLNSSVGFNNTFDMLFKTKIQYSRRLHEHFTVFAGPTINLRVAGNEHIGETVNNPLKDASNWFLYREYDNSIIKGSFGISGGIRL